MLTRFPVYVPSKDRHEEGRAQTVKALRQDGVPFRLVVEPAQAEAYERWAGPEDQLLVLPEDGHGLLKTRNWIRDHAEAEGHRRHWQLDDNIFCFYRLWEGRRVPVHGGVALRVCEDLTERFENVGISGLNYDMFVSSATDAPFRANCHVYSCSLINHEMPCRWRLVYNDDTDLCLQALTNGWATILVNAFTAKKRTTMTLRGGNTEQLYRDGDDADERDTYGRFQMARVLERAWPGTVKVIRNFGRYQHSVNWRAFDVPLRLREELDVDALHPVDEYGMTLRAVRPVQSERIRQLQAGYGRVLLDAKPTDPLWRGLPAFRPGREPPRLAVACRDEATREALVTRLGVTVDKKFKDKAWSAWWPPRGRDDPASLRFEPADSEPPPPPEPPAQPAVLRRSPDARPRYPIYLPTKGRWQPDRALTVKALQRDEVPLRLVVEPQEAEAYERWATERDRLLVLPFSNLGKGSYPARNWIREHAEGEGHARHWQLDDNIIEFRRLWRGRRIPCDAGIALRVCEDFSDRYENVGVSGLNYQMFVPAETPEPFYLNCHVYSATLVNHAMPYRWRLTYNEDTDLCLQALVGGWCTVLLNAFMANKMRTMAMGGGNTDVLYQGDGRLAMAHVLRRAWPGIVDVRWRFGRPQHVINWKKFDTPLRRRPDLDLDALPDADEYGMRLRAVTDVKSAALRELLEAGV